MKEPYMTAAQFKTARKILKLSVPAMADKLRLRSDRTIRKYESGEIEIPGPISLLMEIFIEDHFRKSSRKEKRKAKKT